MHSRLAAVDSIVDSHYDSALVVLAELDSLPMRRADRMYLELLRGKAMNKAGVPFTTDSMMRRVVRYYDRRGSANRRMLAHYVLGCAYRDMKSAPRALEEYQKAVSLADTARADCDLSTLMRVHSQMAALYKVMRLHDFQAQEEDRAMQLAWQTGDTLSALIFEEKACNRLLYEARYDTAIIESLHLYDRYIACGYPNQAAISGINLVKAYLAKRDYASAKHYLDIYETSPLFANASHKVVGGKSSFYIYKGIYYNGIGRTDSAEWCFQKALGYSHPQRNDSTIYRELMNIYQRKLQADSVNKYALLYAGEKEQRYNESMGETLLQLSSLYNYNIEQQIAEEQTRKAHRFRNILSYMVMVTILLMGIIYFYWYRKRRENEAELDRMKLSIQTSRLELARQMAETSRMEQEQRQNVEALHDAEERLKQLVEEQRITSKINKQEKQSADKQIARLKDSVNQLTQAQQAKDLQIRQLTANKRSDQLEDETIVESFIEYVRGNGSHKIDDAEWREFRAVVECHFPVFHDIVFRKRKLTKEEYRACLLVKTRMFSPKELEALLGWPYNFASNKRKQLLKKIFGEEGSAADFDRRIWDIS